MLTVPGTSLLTATLRRLEMLPTAETVVSQVSACAAAEPTASGGGPIAWNCLPMPISFPICAPLMPASRPMTTSKPAATRRYRFQRPCVATGPKFKVPRLSCYPSLCFMIVAELGQAPCNSRDSKSCCGNDVRGTGWNPNRDR